MLNCHSWLDFWAYHTIVLTASRVYGSGLKVSLNGSETMNIPGSGSYAFGAQLVTGATYQVFIVTQPSLPSQTCTISNAAGDVSALMGDITLVCTPYLMAGTFQGRALNLARDVVAFAGAGGAGAFSDAIGAAAQFNGPLETVTPDGRALYVADSANCRIRKIDIATAQVTAFAGNGTCTSIDGVGTGATIKTPFGLTTDGTNLYVSESGGSNKIRKIVIATQVVTTFAGSGATGSFDGVGTSATFNGNNGLTTDNKFLYVADQGNHKIRKIDLATAQVSTVAGGATGGGNCGASCIDANGTAAQFNTPTGLTTDGTNLYVFDYNNHRVRRVVIATGEVSTLAGDGTPAYLDGTGTAAKINVPGRGTTDGFYLYIGQQTGDSHVRKIDLSTLAVTTIAGDGTNSSATGSSGTGKLNQPNGITSDGTYLYASDYGGNFIRILQ